MKPSPLNGESQGEGEFFLSLNLSREGRDLQ